MEKFDLIIIGAGPAGATLARLIKNKKVLVLHGGFKEKPCGGLLAPDAQKSLAKFDLTLPKHILVDPQIFSVRTMDLESGIQRWYQRMYINMSRKKFDDWLIRLIHDEVQVLEATCTHINKNEVTYRMDGKNYTVCTDVIVGADGANSIVRKTFFKPLKTRKYMAIQQWFKCDIETARPFYSCIFDEKTSDCCSWSINKSGYLIFGGAFPFDRCRERFELQKERLRKFDIHLNNPVKTEACQVLRPSGPKSFALGKYFESHSVYLIGEAGGFISPSSLEGFSSAFITATALSDSLDKKNPLKSYKALTGKLKLQLIFKNIKCVFMYTPFLRKLLMKSGLDSIEVRKDLA